MEITNTTKFKASPQLASSEIDGEAVVLNLNDGNYYGLNPVGAAVWQWLAETRTLPQLVGLLTTEYAVDDERARKDLVVLLGDLLKRKLIEVVE